MKKTLQLLIALFTFTYASAQFTVGDLEYTVISGTDVEVSGFSGAAITDIEILAQVSDGGVIYDVVAVGNEAFSKLSDALNDGIKTVVLPASVVTIGNNAFDTQRAMTTINLENVVTIGSSAFAVCDKLTNVDLSSATTLGNYCFNRCHAFTGEFVAPNLVTIGTGSVYNAVTGVGIESFNVPSSVTSIGALFLGRITTLTHVQVNWTADQLNGTNGVTAIGVNAKNFFRNLDIDGGAVTLYVPVGTKAAYEAASPWGLNATTAGQYFNHANIVEGTLADYVPAPTVGNTFSVGDYDYKITSLLPNEVEVTGTSNVALENVNILATATNPADSEVYDVTSVGDEAFKDNTVITSVMFPSSVTALGVKSFDSASKLVTVNLENVKTVGTSCFASCSSLTTTGVLSNATAFGNYCFFSTGALTSLSTPVAESYGDGFLRNSGIVSFEIPSTVTSIGNQLFRDASSLTTVTLNWASPSDVTFTDDTTTFKDLTESNITINVPTGTVSAYQAVTPWNTITNITDGSTLSADVFSTEALDVFLNGTVLTVVNGSELTSVAVYDITGKQLVAGNGTSLDVSRLSTGVYIIKVTNDSEGLVKRVVKN